MNMKKIAMAHRKKIALIAHDNKKPCCPTIPTSRRSCGWPSCGTSPSPATGPPPTS